MTMMTRVRPPAVTVVSTVDSWRHRIDGRPGRYEFTRRLKLSNGETVDHVIECNNPAYAKRQCDALGSLAVGGKSHAALERRAH